MKKIGMLFIAISLYGIGFAQGTVTFGYDLAGNRISRVIEMVSSSLRSDTTKTVPVVYSETLSDIQIRIYPNPTDGLIKVEILNLPPQETAEVMLYQFSGKLLLEKQGVSSFTELNITGQPAGVYILKIVVNGKHSEWKIIKK